jgi:subtilisin family serine protease
MSNGKDKEGRGNMAERRGVRRKLDPRLAAIVSLSQSELAELRRIEEKAIDDRLGKLEEERERLEVQGDLPQKQEDLDLYTVDDERTAVRGVSRMARARLLQMAVQLHGIDFKKPDSPTASVFIKFRGDINRIERLGAKVRSIAGDIATTTIPLDSISALEADDDILFIELSRPAFPDLDDSVPLIEADTHHSATPPITGAGSIVGIIDYGMDFHHPDFRDPTTGNTRVLWLWHQDPPAGTSGTAGAAPAPWGYGLEYSGTDINNDLTSVDPVTGDPTPYSVVDHRAGVGVHGTHVAGIAAGNGAGDGVHIGVAPGVDIIFVDTVGSGTLAVADLTQISDALNYIFTRAGATPCVVNLSLGDNLGPHDGTSLAEQFIDNMLITPGRAVTIAAGNANQDDKHATGVVPNGGVQNIQIDVLATVPVGRSESLEIWYDGQDLFDVTLTDPLGNALGPVSPGGTLASPLGTTNVTITSVQNDPRNNDNLISIIFQPTAGNRITPGAWQLQLSGNSGGSPSVVNGRWHGWIDRNTRTRMVWNAPTGGNLTLGTPGTARRAITVASHFKTGAQALRGSSGRGPTRDGRIKPEVTAPGVSIEAPRSRDMTLPAPGALYTTMGGTSMASPHVAGTVALLFECRGAGLSAADAKYILQNLVDTTGIASVPDVGFGWGRVRVANACAWAITGPDVWTKTNSADTGIEPYAGPEAWRSPDIWVRPNRDGGTSHENPEFGQENHVHVVVRNRGTGPAYNTQVHLYWADPATNIPFAQWQTAGIRVGTEETNVQIIPELAAGADLQTAVPFSWFPPAPGSNIRGDDHFCLLARIENESDPSNVGPGGWSCVRDHNNIALKNVHIVDILPDTTEADATFYVFAEDLQTSLLINARKLPKGARPIIQMPVQAIDLSPLGEVRQVVKHTPLLDLASVYKAKERVRLASSVGRELAMAKVELDGGRLSASAGIHGIKRVQFAGPLAHLTMEQPLAMVEWLVAQPKERIPIRIRVHGLRGKIGETFEISVEQWADGNPVGGMTTIFRIVPPRKLVTKPKRLAPAHRAPSEVLLRWVAKSDR